MTTRRLAFSGTLLAVGTARSLSPKARVVIWSEATPSAISSLRTDSARRAESRSL
jgi:hypothetical protein